MFDDSHEGVLVVRWLMPASAEQVLERLTATEIVLDRSVLADSGLVLSTPSSEVARETPLIAGSARPAVGRHLLIAISI